MAQDSASKRKRKPLRLKIRRNQKVSINGTLVGANRRTVLVIEPGEIEIRRIDRKEDSIGD